MSIKTFTTLVFLGPKTQQSCRAREIYRALRAVNLIKEKRCGKIKGITSTDGSCQRTYILQEEATSPNIALEPLFALLLSDAH